MLTKFSRAFIALLLSHVLCASVASAQNIQRGFANYQAILNGQKKLEQLSQEERNEVLWVHRRMAASRSSDGQSPSCKSAREEAEQAANELADYARRLLRCAEGMDFSDDCSSEFRRTRSAHSDYESAISSVSSDCR